ncbi:uncharacterized protein [Venturia canescens]|uniref:uncharacterized protein isoform X1 n=1 Tax=Venturia canescens TaxID=32260 RepID=UPI001C9C1636|nr:uncharacterized protein LOC122406467 isoform X1 [Venturia canescens]
MAHTNGIDVERLLREQVASIKSVEEYNYWEKQCLEFIESLEEQVSPNKRPRLSTGHQHSVTARIIRLQGLLEVTRSRFQHTGAGLNDRGLVWKEINSAFVNRIVTGAVINRNYIVPRQFLKDAYDLVEKRVKDCIVKFNSVKVNTEFNAEFATGDQRTHKSINTANVELFQTSDLKEWYEERVIEPTLASLDEFQECDSGWTLVSITNLTVNINKYNPMRAGCHIRLPREIMLKKAVVNVKSNDNACFAWAVVAALHPAELNVNRQSSYPHYSTILNLQNIDFPMTLNQIKKFEQLNDVSINVYGITKSGIAPLYITKRKRGRHVNLLYIENEEGDRIGHFTLIKDLSRLVSSQLSSKNHKKYICARCLQYFSMESKLRAHELDCGKMNDCAIRLPAENDKWLEFTNHNRKERLPFIVYADLECVLEKTGEREREKNRQHHHKVFSIGFYVSCSYDSSLSGYYSRRSEDCIGWFVEQLKELALRVEKILLKNVPMKELSPAEWKKFREDVNCHICEKPFVEKEQRVRDHCHLTGQFRGPAHGNCNLNYKNSFFIPIVFHNLSGYDAHFIIKEVATAFEGKIDLLPLTKEKYISFSKTVKSSSHDYRKEIRLRFIDSFKFMSSSLDKLASLLLIDQLKVLKSQFSNISHDDFTLLTRKGVFPYEYIDSFEKLNDTELPPRDAFYSSLADTTISESEYQHAQTVWERFSIQTLGEYSDLYLKTDVLLLADIFENFRVSSTKLWA